MGKRFGGALTLCVAGALAAAGVAQGAIVSGDEVRPGVPALYFTAAAGEANDITIRAKNAVSTGPNGVAFGPHVITFADEGTTLTTGGEYPCQLLSPHKARCTSPNSEWPWMQLDLLDGPDRVRMRRSVGYPTTQIYSNGGGNRFTLRGPRTFLSGAFDGDVVRFRPPGGGGVIIGGSPTLKLVDGASESVDCHSPGDPRIFSDPLDTISPYCG